VSSTTRSGLVKPGYSDTADIEVINDNMEKIEDLLDEKANLTDLTTPFNFKGSCTYANLPSYNRNQNDTWYVTDRKCRYTWTGSAWKQSSLDEGDYEDELNAITTRLDALGLYVDSDGDICQGEEES